MSNLILIISLVSVANIIGAFGSLFLKLGSKDFHMNISLNGIINILRNWRLILGVVLYVSSAVVFIATLRLGELSIIYPLTSMTYIFVTILSAWILKERINVYKILGVLCIITGVVFVTL
jgi:drug/metabolite transporter (DMT)-like permease